MYRKRTEDGEFLETPAGRSEDLFDVEWVTRLFHASPLGILLADAEDRCIYTNSAYQQVSGLTLQQALGTSWNDSVHPEDRQRVSDEWLQAVQSGAPFHSEVRFLRPDGRVLWTRLHADTSQGAGGTRANLLMVEDITERKSTEAVLRAAEEKLFAEKERAQVTLDSIGDAVLTTDLAGNVTYLNLEAEELTGWSREDAVGRPLAEVFRIIDGETRETAPNPAQLAMDDDRKVGLALGCILVRRGGSKVEIEDSAAPIHNRDGGVTGAVIVFHDVAQSRVMAERMAHLARHDFLTGLPNPVLLTERLTQCISLAHQQDHKVALLFVDLDDFKGVNDAMGHLIGDQLLRSIAARLVACVRATDTVSRRGGDEFVILLSEIACPEDAAHVAENVLEAISAPHKIDGRELKVSASIGVSVYPDDSTDLVELVRQADSAMYHVKARGADGYRFSGYGRIPPHEWVRSGRSRRGRWNQEETQDVTQASGQHKLR